MSDIYLTKEELEHLIKITDNARTTPAFGFSSEQVLSGNDFAQMAWKRVRAYWQELSQKYNFNPEQVKGIDAKTGKVLL